MFKISKNISKFIESNKFIEAIWKMTILLIDSLGAVRDNSLILEGVQT